MNYKSTAQTHGGSLNPTVLNWATLPVLKPRGTCPNYLRSLPECLLSVEGSHPPCARLCRDSEFRSWRAGGRGPCNPVLLPGCRTGLLSGNSLRSSASRNHLQTPAVNGSFRFSCKIQMHLDTRFLTAFSGIHRNAFWGKKIHPIKGLLCNTFKRFVLQAFPPSTTSSPPFSFMQSERFSTLITSFTGTSP